MRISRGLKPFDRADWLFELKHDGFRALAFVEDGECRLVSHNRNTFRTFPAVTDKGSPHWIKIKNPNYSQAEGREELFEHGSESVLCL